jgi:uncharacterized protein YqgV (UPF0045/DUF77 family)
VRKSDHTTFVQTHQKSTKTFSHAYVPANKHTEGSWDEVMRVIGQAHCLLHTNGVVRIQSDIRVGSRTDKKQSPADKVAKVQQLLAQDEEDEKAKAKGKKGDEEESAA